MYMVRIVTGPVDVASYAADLKAEILTAGAPADGLEHVFVQLADGRIGVVLYLLPRSSRDVCNLAEQLCRRALSVCLSGTQWEITTCTVHRPAD